MSQNVMLDNWVRASPKCRCPWKNWCTCDMVMGTQGSMMFVGWEGWLIWSDPTEDLVKHKLQKKLMLAMIEMCQNTEGIDAYYLWGHIVAGSLEWPCWPLFTTKSAYNYHMSIRTGPGINERRWPGLMNHFFFNIMCCQVPLCSLPGEEIAPGEESKREEAVWCSGQYSARKPWILAYICGYYFDINCSCLFQQDNAPCYAAKIVHEYFEEHNKEFNWSRFPISHFD